MSLEHLDVLIVGAGLSGISAAYHLRHRRLAVLEAREELGGTWSLFRYPGVRSDSDMHTLGFRFRPWGGARAIADGPSILRYLQETARETGVTEHIRYGKRAARATWSTPDARWTVDVQDTRTGTVEQVTCSFLLGCTGYYRYDRGHSPQFPGAERFAGTVVHPQHWPDDLDVAGRRVVVIGSGATAVTLAPALAREGAHVTMLQRSPSYVLSLPSVDPIAERLGRVLPRRAASSAIRWKNILLQIGLYQLSQRRPATVKRLLRTLVRRAVPAGYDVDRHFGPRYDPWDQRMCIVPDGDLFRAIRAGQADVVTDEVETFTERGVLLRSGTELEADVIVTATGLRLLMLGGIKLVVDGDPVDLRERMVYKGMMIEGVPNLAFTLGYINASWTLRADLTSEHVARVLDHMDARGHGVCVPRNDDPAVEHQPLLELKSGYVQRVIDWMPKSGSKGPWRAHRNYAVDRLAVRRGGVDDGVLRFPAPAD